MIRFVPPGAGALWLLLATMTSCGESPEVEQPTEPVTEESPTASAEGNLRGGQPLHIDLQLEGLSPLYKGFFKHVPFVEQLGRDLAPHVKSRAATVKVVWDAETVTGTIQMLVPDGESALAATGGELERTGNLDPEPVAPYLAAIEGYRRVVGDRFDLRVLSFGLALELWDPRSECRCLWSAVEGEGIEFGPSIRCRDPFGESLEVTRDGDAWPATIRGNKKAKKALLGALGQ